MVRDTLAAQAAAAKAALDENAKAFAAFDAAAAEEKAALVASFTSAAALATHLSKLDKHNLRQAELVRLARRTNRRALFVVRRAHVRAA